MLYLVRVSVIRQILSNKAPEYINFFWRTGGGRNALILTENPEKVKEVYEREYKNPSISIEEAPKDVHEFFKLLRQFIDLDYRIINDNVVEVAVITVGKLIGKRGRNIKAIQRHIGKKIKVVQGILVHYDFFDNVWRRSLDNKTISCSDPVIQLNEQDLFWYKPDPSHGYAPSWGYIAPWKLYK